MQFLERLPYGNSVVVELDTFTRMLNDQILDTEEIRKFWAGPYEYVCLAPSGSPLNEPVWCAIRVTWINGKKTRIQFQENMTYSDITSGWTL